MLTSKIDLMWKLNGEFELIELGNNYYILKVAEEEKRESILTEGPWMVAGKFVTTKKWYPDFKASLDKLNTTNTWVRIPELAVEYYQKSIIFLIASSIGEPIKIDQQTFCATKGKFARFCVQLDLDKSLERAVMVNGKLYQVVYENIPTLCYDCGRVGHRSADVGKRKVDSIQTKNAFEALSNNFMDTGDFNMSENVVFGAQIQTNVNNAKGLGKSVENLGTIDNSLLPINTNSQEWCASAIITDGPSAPGGYTTKKS